MVRPRASATVPRSLLLAKHAVDGCPRGAGHRSDVLLPERDDAGVVRRRELDQASANARLRVDVVRLDDAIRRAPKLLGEQAQEHVLDTGVLPLQEREVVAEDRTRLPRLERLDRRRAPGVGEEESQLAEALTRPENVDEHAVAERREQLARRTGRGRRGGASRPGRRDGTRPRRARTSGGARSRGAAGRRPAGGRRAAATPRRQVCVTTVTLATSWARTTPSRSAPSLGT